MAESAADPPPRPPFESPVVATYPPAPPDASLTLTDESARTKLLIRAAADGATAARLGVGFGDSRLDGEALVCGQRPGEWLVVGSAAAARAIIDEIDDGDLVSVIDHTHASALFRLTGDAAPLVLEKLCNLDWSDDTTPHGAVGSATVAAVNCDLVRHDQGTERSYLIAGDRSFGQYLFDAVLDAGAEFEIAATATVSPTITA